MTQNVVFVTNFRAQDQGTTFSSSNSWSEINKMQLTLAEFEIFKYLIFFSASGQRANLIACKHIHDCFLLQWWVQLIWYSAPYTFIIFQLVAKTFKHERLVTSFPYTIQNTPFDSTRSSQQRFHEMGHVRSQSIFVLASPYWLCWSFSTGPSGVQFLHPSIRYVRFHLKTERKGSKSTQAVYFCEAKAFSAIILVNHSMPTSGFGVLDGITQCDL